MYGPWDLNSLELVNGEDLGRLNRGQICQIVLSDPAPGFDIDPPVQRPPGTRPPRQADGFVRQGAPAGASPQLLNQPASPSCQQQMCLFSARSFVDGCPGSDREADGQTGRERGGDRERERETGLQKLNSEDGS